MEVGECTLPISHCWPFNSLRCLEALLQVFDGMQGASSQPFSGRKEAQSFAGSEQVTRALSEPSSRALCFSQPRAGLGDSF